MRYVSLVASILAMLVALQSADARQEIRSQASAGADATATLGALRETALTTEFDPAASAESKGKAWKTFYQAALLCAGGRLDPLAAGAVPYLINSGIDDIETREEVERLRQAIAVLAPVRDRHAPQYAMAVGLAAYRLAALLGKPSDALSLLGDTGDWYAAHLTAMAEKDRLPEDYNAQGRLAFGLGKTMAQLGRYKEAAAYQKLNWESVTRARGPYDAYTNNAEQAYAVSLYLAGDGGEAERIARDAAETVVAHYPANDPQIVSAFGAFAQILVRGGKRYEALDYMRRANDVARAAFGTADTRYLASVYALGDVLTALERYGDADAALSEASRGFEKAEGNSGRMTLALARAGIVELPAGQPKVAAASLERALAIARAKDAKEQAIGPVIFPTLALALHDIGRNDDARRYAAQLARELPAGDPFPIELAQADLLAAYLASDGGNSDAARAAARRVVEIVRSKTYLAKNGALPQGDRTALDIVLRVAAESNDAQLALDAMVILTGSKIAQASHLLADRLASADPALAARIRAFQDAAREAQSADRALLSAVAKGEGVEPARQRRDAAGRAVAQLRAAISKDYSQWTEASGMDAVDVAQMRRGLASNAGLMAVVPAFDGVYTLVLTHDGARVRRVVMARQPLTDMVGKLRASLQSGDVDRATAHALYQQLFPAADAGMLRRISSLRFVPGGVFATLPFDLLLQRQATSVSAAPSWLIRRFAISISPRFVADRPMRTRAGGGGSFLGVGAPTPFGESSTAKILAARHYFRGGGIDRRALADLPPLAASTAELRGASRYFGAARSTLLTGDDASEARIEAMDLRPYSTILFSTHGLVGGEIEGVAEPALVLAKPNPNSTSDGLLTATEIARLRLDADWIILSACNTAAGEGGEAPVYSGLAQAFRYAGARTLLLSHWPVRDDAARFVAVATIANARAGMPRDVALQRAKLSLMASRTIPGAADPYIWAPYILLGDTAG